MVSYTAYSQVPYREDLRWVFAEYLVVLLAPAYDLSRSNPFGLPREYLAGLPA